MVEGRFRITNELGLHARYATVIVKKANEFVSKIIIQCKNVETDLKSIMGVMSLAVSYNEIITIKVTGIDEEEALKALSLQILELKVGKEL